MAKAKGKKVNVKAVQVGKEAAKSVQQSINLIEKAESNEPTFTEQDLDNDMKDILKQMGALQAKYRQIRSNKRGQVSRLILYIRSKNRAWKP